VDVDAGLAIPNDAQYVALKVGLTKGEPPPQRARVLGGAVTE
jgi:hypothetical protein